MRDPGGETIYDRAQIARRGAAAAAAAAAAEQRQASDFAESGSKMNEQLAPRDKRLTLYPEIVPYRTGRLKVSDLHELYFEECGSPAGKPAVLLHGGPGGGINPMMRRYHDPRAYRIVLFDQRGCGRSTPACLARGQHHLASRRRHRAPARASRRRTLAGVRRLMGLDARARLRRDLPRARHRARAAEASSPCGARSSNGSIRKAAAGSFPTRSRTMCASSPRPSAAT